VGAMIRDGMICEGCGSTTGTVGCQDGKVRCANCAVEDGFDQLTGESEHGDG
jgi:hypothetical protein